MAEPKSLFDTPALKRREELINLIVRSLDAFTRDRAIATVLLWIPQDELEDIAPTLSGMPDILNLLPKD
jgi:hypothetical protein